MSCLESILVHCCNYCGIIAVTLRGGGGFRA